MFRRKFGVETKEARTVLFGLDAPKVLSGPFTGVQYFDEPVWGSIVPKWLGSYECELHDVVATFAKTGYQAVIDVGCAEGYYAVGLAKAAGVPRVYAFDTDPVSRRQARRLAKINNVEGVVEVRRWCDHAAIAVIAGTVKGRVLLFCDIEGFEVSLLLPAECPALLACDILVEVHDKVGEALICQTIKDRFAQSHTVEEISAEPRDEWSLRISSHPRFADIPTEWLSRMSQEHRVMGRSWLWCRSRSAAGL